MACRQTIGISLGLEHPRNASAAIAGCLRRSVGTAAASPLERQPPWKEPVCRGAVGAASAAVTPGAMGVGQGGRRVAPPGAISPAGRHATFFCPPWGCCARWWRWLRQISWRAVPWSGLCLVRPVLAVDWAEADGATGFFAAGFGVAARDCTTSCAKSVAARWVRASSLGGLPHRAWRCRPCLAPAWQQVLSCWPGQECFALFQIAPRDGPALPASHRL